MAKAKNPLDPSVHSDLARSWHAQGRSGDSEAVLIDAYVSSEDASRHENAFPGPTTPLLATATDPSELAVLLGLIAAVWMTLMLPGAEGVLRSQDQAGFPVLDKAAHTTTVSPELAATNAVQPFNPILFPVDSVVPLLDLVSGPHGIPTLPRQLG